MDMKNNANWTDLRTCVSPEGRFVFGLHLPRFDAVNLRQDDHILSLGKTDSGLSVLNNANFPAADIKEIAADAIIEVPNPFPFRGTTFINKRWADRTARTPSSIAIQAPRKVSLCKAIQKIDANDISDKVFQFMMDRLRGYYLDLEYSHQSIEAVLALQASSPYDIHQRLSAVATFSTLEAASDLAAANKRISNICKSNFRYRYHWYFLILQNKYLILENEFLILQNKSTQYDIINYY